MANQEDIGGADPHEEIVRLEEHIEGLAAKIESCRKFILAARIAVAGGGLTLAAMPVGVIRSDLGLMADRVGQELRRSGCHRHREPTVAQRIAAAD